MAAKKPSKEDEEKEEKKEEPVKKTKTVTFELPSFSGMMKDENFKMKIPLLFLILLFFSFAAFLFEKANFHTIDLVDLARMQYNVQKLWSLGFMLFMVLFALYLALCVHFGYKLGKIMSLLVLPVTLIGAVILGIMFPSLSLVFIAFALTGAFASLFSSMKQELTLSTAWATIGKALLIFVILAFAVTYLKVSANPDMYTEKLFDSAVGLMPELGASLSSVIQSVEVDETMIKSVVTRDAFGKAITPKQVQDAIEQIPGITSFNASLREKWSQQVQQQLTSEAGYNAFIKSAAVAMKEIKNQLAEQIANQTATPDKGLATMAKAQAEKIPQLKALFQNIGVLLAFSVLSLVSVLNFFIKLIATLMVWALKKIAF
ncbi:hypothetical protein HZC09_03690 [Candidatus Micrarchaeota archaeon]|nr:hypothetical protein [Candidatus Micrarchaeota archaeon]